nr:MAG TPA_asm: hypothetical protein [Caudoviricetes sp.]
MKILPLIKKEVTGFVNALAEKFLLFEELL